MQYDFLAETMELSLPLPFTYEGVKVTGAVIKKLYSIEISKLKSAVASLPENMNPRLRYMLYSREVSLAGISYFCDASGKEIKSISEKILLDNSPPQNLYKLMLFITMLTNERSLVATAYKCINCSKFTLFDLDPGQDVPKNVEEERAFMEDLLEFIKESPNKKGDEIFTHKLNSPITLKGDENTVIYSMAFKYPSTEDYIKSLKDSKRKDAVDLWVLFDNLVRINELTEEDTKRLKSEHGFDKVFRMKSQELQVIVDYMNVYGTYIEHKYTCKLCGHENPSTFDLTNFFDFLRTS